MQADSEVWKLCDEFFHWRLQEFPEFATFCGHHEFDDRLNDHSVDAFQRRAAAVQEFLSKVSAAEASVKLTDTDATNLMLLKYELSTFLNGTLGEDPHGYLFVLSYMDGIHVDFEQLISWTHFETIEDFHMYLKRLQALTNRIQDDIKVLQHAVSVGCTHSIYSVEDVPRQLHGITDSVPEETVFFAPFKSASTSIELALLEPLKLQAIAEIKNCIQPAFAQLADYIKQEYLKACRPREGVDNIPGGAEFYAKCLHWHTSLNITPQQVHDIGLAEIERIRKEMDKTINKSGFVGDFAAFINYLRTDPKFYYDNKEDCLAGFKNICYDHIRPALPKLFPKIPQSQLLIKTMPETRAAGPAAYYMAGTLDGKRPGIFYVNNHHLKNCPKYSMMTLSLHEGEPGHHLQGMYSIECTGMPLFRRYMEDMYYSHAPSKFPIHTALCEGWALYCESLGYELGLFEDPFTEFGHLSDEMLRACRLAADTGLHALGWTFEQAVKLFLDNTAFAEEEIRREVRRYITWPAQACAYKIGQLKITELRKAAQTALGSKFDVRLFHDEILRAGLMPLDVLENTIKTFIDSHREA